MAFRTTEILDFFLKKVGSDLESMQQELEW